MRMLPALGPCAFVLTAVLSCGDAAAPAAPQTPKAPAAAAAAAAAPVVPIASECSEPATEIEAQAEAAVVQSPQPAPATPQAGAQPMQAEWDEAMKLKTKAEYGRAADLFDTIAAGLVGQPRGRTALIEAGSCLMSHGRSQQKLGVNSPESKATFEKALKRFEMVLAEPQKPESSRAQYLRGSVQIFAGELAKAEQEYTLCMERWPADHYYRRKSLERRAYVRRQLLKTDDAIADLDKYLVDFAPGKVAHDAKEYTSVQLHRRYAAAFGKAAPALASNVWAQGAPQDMAKLKGEVVAVLFFATWCENCEKARAQVQAQMKRYENLVKFVGVMDDQLGQTVDTVRAWLPGKGYRLPVMHDVGQQSMRAFQSDSLPEIVLVDRAGNVRWHDHAANLQDATLELILVDDGSK